MDKLWGCLIAMLLVGGVCIAQNKVVIKGRVLNAADVGQLYIGDGSVLRPLEVVDEYFVMTQDVPVLPTPISLSVLNIKNGKITNLTPELWVTSHDVKLEVNLKDAKKYSIEPEAAYQNISEKIQYADGKLRYALIETHKNSFPALFFLYQDVYFNEMKDVRYVKGVVEELEVSYRESYLGRLLSAFLEVKKVEPYKVHEKMFSLQAYDEKLDEMAVLAENGKTKLICYTATGCGFSEPAIRFLEEMDSELDDTAYEIITVWDDGSYEMWQEHLPELKKMVTWKNLWDQYKFVRFYLNIDMTPTFFIVDGNGVLKREVKGIGAKQRKTILKALKRT